MIKKSSSNTKQNVIAEFNKVHRYLWLILLLFFILIYGFIIYKVNGYMNQQPTPAAVSLQLQATPQATINPKIVQQLNSLKNNSVSVKALFNQARNNPFY